MIPHIISNENVSATFDVTESDSGSTNNFQGKEINTKIRHVKITLSLKNGYSWTGLSETAKTKNIVLNFSIPAPVLEEITLLTKWEENNFTLNDDAFVFENKLDQNYEGFSWKTKDEVLNWFKQTKTSKELSTVAEGDDAVTLDKQKFVGLFFNKILLNDDFKFVPKQPSGSDKETTTDKLSKSSFLPHEINDKGVDAKVKVTDIPPTARGYAADNTKGNQKKVEITLTPKPGYGWNLIQNTTNRTKPIKFILNMDASDALIPINGLLNDKLIKTYTSKEKGDKPVYWFECNSHDEDKSIKTKFNYSKATQKIQDLVKKAVYAGPNQEAKTKAAANELWTVNEANDKFTWDSQATEAIKNKKFSYLNKDFDLSKKDNFDIFKGLVIDQDFINASNETTSGVQDGQALKNNAYLAVAGSTLWYLNESQQSDLAEQIKCSLMISTSIDTSTSNKDDKEIVYYVSFRLEPRNGGNWKNSNNNNPIDIDVTFDVKNVTSIMDITPTKSPKAGLTRPSINTSNSKIEFEGTLKKEFFNGQTLNDKTAVENYFKKSSSGGQRKLQNASDINLDKIKKLPAQLDGNLINKEIKKEKNGQTSEQPSQPNTFEFPGTNLSFKYLSDNNAPSSSGWRGYYKNNLSSEDTNYINEKLMFIKNLEVTDKTKNFIKVESSAKSYTIQFELELDKTKNTNWYWGSWNDLLPDNKNANQGNNLLIKLNVTI